MICRKRIQFLFFALAIGTSWQIGAQTSPKKTLPPLSIELDEKTIVLPCPPGFGPPWGRTASIDSVVEVLVKTAMPAERVQHRIDVSAGSIIGSGTRVQWNLEGHPPGSYFITVTEFHNGKQNGEPATAGVTIENALCGGDCDCASLDVAASTGAVKENGKIVFTATVIGGPITPTYNWTVEGGVIVSGQGTPSIEVQVKRKNKSNLVKAVLQLGNLIPECQCPSTDSATVRIVSKR